MGNTGRKNKWLAAAVVATFALLGCDSEDGGTTPAGDSSTTTDTAAGSDTTADTASTADTAAGTDAIATSDTAAATDAAAGSDTVASTDATAETDATAGTDATVGSDTTSNCGTVAWKEVEANFSASCGGCHSGSFKYDATNCASVSAMASKIITKIEDGSMPKGGTLGAVAKGKMLLWLNGGASCAVCN